MLEAKIPKPLLGLSNKRAAGGEMVGAMMT